MVVDKEGAGQYVTRTVVGDDGGVAIVTAGPLNLDLTAPAAHRSRGSATGRTYKGRARIAQCAGSDALSGLASCTVTIDREDRSVPWPRRVTATATDVAGNATTRSVTLRGARRVGGAVHASDGSSVDRALGHRTGNLHVMSTEAPRLKARTVRSTTTRFKMVGPQGRDHPLGGHRSGRAARSRSTARSRCD